jgi:predicted MFS family arabinose efflux permease
MASDSPSSNTRGWIVTLAGLGINLVLGSRYGGMVRDLIGSYAIAYQICAGMLIVAVILAFATRAPKEPARQT